MGDTNGIEKMASLFAKLFKDHWKLMTGSERQYFESAIQAFAYLADIHNHRLVSQETLDLLNEVLDDLYGYAKSWNDSVPPKMSDEMYEMYEFALNALKANYIVTIKSDELGTRTEVRVFDETVFTAPFVTPPKRHNFSPDQPEHERAALLATDYALCTVYGERVEAITPASNEYLNDPSFGIF